MTSDAGSVPSSRRRNVQLRPCNEGSCEPPTFSWAMSKSIMQLALHMLLPEIEWAASVDQPHPLLKLAIHAVKSVGVQDSSPF